MIFPDHTLILTFFQEMYVDRIIYCKPKYYTIVNFVGDKYDFKPSVNLKQANVRSVVNLDLVPGKI